MKPLMTILAAAAATLGGAVAYAQQDSRPTDAQATFIDAQGQTTGQANLFETGTGVLIELEVENMPGGRWIAFHIHEHGSCDAHEDHEPAGEHFDPEDSPHGYFAAGGPHAGDMPNLYVPDNGVVRAHVFNSMVRIDGDEVGIRGRSLMLHEQNDDDRSQPSGESGDRIACAVIE